MPNNTMIISCQVFKIPTIVQAILMLNHKRKNDDDNMNIEEGTSQEEESARIHIFLIK